MKTLLQNDTIAAIATPVGEGGIAVIRLSGQNAILIAQKIFSGKKKLAEAKSRHVQLGSIVIPGEGEVDTVLVTVFRNPLSYTGEDVVEISCHGGYLITQKILTAVIDSGARMAQPGEFTYRAFVNGKLDLTQAEAVADLIHSQSERSRKSSMDQLHGRLGKAVSDLRKRIISICALLELELDFSEEGIELAKKDEYKIKITKIIKDIEGFLTTYKAGKMIKDGVKVVLTGKPNVGKSSLLNILLKENRAIVSHIPGTTRDVIEEDITIDGILFRLFDTAGLRDTNDEIETEGIKRAKAAMESSDVILRIVDQTKPIDQNEYEKEILLSEEKQVANPSIIIVVNKIDLQKDKNFALPNELLSISHEVSCKTHQGIDELKSLLVDIALPKTETFSEGLIIQNIRHKVAFEKCCRSLLLALKSIEAGLSSEFVAMDVRNAIDHLGDIIGITTPDDILNTIFSDFCIGK
jgi:tRNA modification GTPase